jgi:hypothetical protein
MKKQKKKTRITLIEKKTELQRSCKKRAETEHTLSGLRIEVISCNGTRGYPTGNGLLCCSGSTMLLAGKKKKFSLSCAMNLLKCRVCLLASAGLLQANPPPPPPFPSEDGSPSPLIVGKHRRRK